MTYSSDHEEDFITRYEGRFSESSEETPITFAEASEIFTAYKNLLRRFEEITGINDSYRFQLLDLKTRLEHASRVDYLTGLPNRIEMYQRLEVERSRSMRHGKSFALIMADIDCFREINDSYGHDIGDRVLMATARVLSGDLRKEDSCARWGGEEFLILLPETGKDEALKVAERLRAMVNDLVLHEGTTEIRPSISLGISVYAKGENIDACIRRAEDSLYQAKNAGRNCSVFRDTAAEVQTAAI